MKDTLWTRDMAGCPAIWWRLCPPHNTIERLKRLRDEQNAIVDDEFDKARLTTYEEYRKERDAWEAAVERNEDPWKECTEIQFYDMLNCMPPLRHTRSFFFVGECYTHSEKWGAMHSLYVRKGEKFYHAIRAINMGMDDILIEIEKIN